MESWNEFWRRPRARWESALALVWVVVLLACYSGSGNPHRPRDVEGSWGGTAEDKKTETTYDLGLEIERLDSDGDGKDDDLNARVTLDDEVAWATKVRSGSKRTVRIWYAFPSGRTGRIRGRVNNSGYVMRGVLRLEEDGQVLAPRFELGYGGSVGTAEVWARSEPTTPPAVAAPVEPEPAAAEVSSPGDTWQEEEENPPQEEADPETVEDGGPELAAER